MTLCNLYGGYLHGPIIYPALNIYSSEEFHEKPRTFIRLIPNKKVA